jgi:Family of unknown function (DUF6527)
VLRHQFVDRIPDHLENGVLYVSIPYATAVHRCGCGCGNEVVTPLSPTDWKLIFDGETVSLKPSIGNWSFACQSHYWIVRNRLRWTRRWSAAEIQRGRDHDRSVKELHFGSAQTPPDDHVPAEGDPAGGIRRAWRTLRRLLQHPQRPRN